MTINPDDPWYPIKDRDDRDWDEPGVTIRLKLAAMAMQGGYPQAPCRLEKEGRDWLVPDAFAMADAMIERANRDA